jgi:DNA-binding GntR family transcriptional regulator
VSPGPTFDRVYLALKEQLTSGRFAPGDHLEPSALGDELSASITPVRDALHRLVGERIVEAPRNDGFRVPAPTEAELRHLYGWNGDLVELALRARAAPALRLTGGKPADPFPVADLQAVTAELFRRIGRRSGNPEIEAAIDNLSDRLGALRLVEAALFADAADELAAIQAAWVAEDMLMLRRCSAAYHRRRQRQAPEILATAHSLGRDR